MSEDFLQFIWKNQLAGNEQLLTADNQVVEVIRPGYQNNHAGPDFEDARLRINGTLWAGNVEVHLRASDWYKHNHQFDDAYNNVILHVVLEHDKTIFRSDGSEIPTLVLMPPDRMAIKYNHLMESRKWIPCEDSIAFTDDFLLKSWQEKMTIERLEEKVSRVKQVAENTSNNWEQVLWVFIARALGSNVNAAPMQRLLQNIPLAVLAKHIDNPLQTEALLYGSAGLLEAESPDEHATHLNREYAFLKGKYNLPEMETHNWKFLRLRPANFPHARLAQLTALILKTFPLFEAIKNAGTLSGIMDIINAEITDYWKNHVRLGVPAARKSSGNMSADARHLIIINAIVPVFFAYGTYSGNDGLKDKAVDWLYAIPPEKNNIIKKWTDLGVKSSTAANTQALLHIKNKYCEHKKCLNCAIGGKLVMEA